MFTATEADKQLDEMTEGELEAIVAASNHTIRMRRYVNRAHLGYLMDRLHAAETEMARR